MHVGCEMSLQHNVDRQLTCTYYVHEVQDTNLLLIIAKPIEKGNLSCMVLQYVYITHYMYEPEGLFCSYEYVKIVLRYLVEKITERIYVL